MQYRAFTLIELLVVVTIIVMLMAMLTPAMDQAIYQAELAVCGARLDAISSGVHSYAMNQQRSYPYREAMNTRVGSVPAESPVTPARKRWGWPNVVVDEGYGAGMQGDRKFYDDRPTLAPFLGGPSLKVLHDPLTGGSVDFAIKGSSVMTDYMLWFGLRFTGAGGGRGMYRVGDRLEWTHAGQPQRFAILASDRDVQLPGGGSMKVWSSHPDAEGKMYLLQSIAPPNWVLARWQRLEDNRRGPLDNNYAYTDGSVRRINAVKYDDARMGRTPMPIDSVSTVFWNWLPPSD